jgi:hypothetical protein
MAHQRPKGKQISSEFVELLNRGEVDLSESYQEPQLSPPEPRTPKLPYYSYFSEHFSERYEPVSDTSAFEETAPLRGDGFVKSTILVSYTLIMFSAATTIVTIVAFVLTRNRSEASSLSFQSTPIYKGQCDSRSLQYLNLFAHLFVNCVGTVILGLSNYIQQLCASPTIQDVSEGFQNRGDILFGSNSPTAVFRLGQRSLTALWIALLITSLPLHLTLNGITGFAAKSVEATRTALFLNETNQLTPVELSWTNVSSYACANLLISSRAHVVSFDNITIIVNTDISSAALTYYNGTGEEYYASSSDMDYCLVNEIQSECQLTLRWFPLLMADVAIVAKAIMASLAIRRHPHFKKQQFITVGDMVVLAARHPEIRQFLPDTGPWRGAVFDRPYAPQRIQWRKTLGRLDLLVALCWWLSAVGVLALGITSWEEIVGGLQLSVSFRRFGLGTEDPATTLASGTTGKPFQEGPPFPAQVIWANLPQVWLTIGYLTWNNMIGRIWLEKEWRSYYGKRKLPRVSYNSRQPGVRSARWLQLPYWLTGLLMSVSIFLHWLVSQTLFVVEIYFANPNISSVFHLHYSPLAIIFVGTLSLILVLGITIYYFVPIKTWMPVMAGSARVVFESCSKLNTLPRTGIGWGDISMGNDRCAGFGGIVGTMVEGVRYPGYINEEYSSQWEYPHMTEFDTEPLVRRKKMKSREVEFTARR